MRTDNFFLLHFCASEMKGALRDNPNNITKIIKRKAKCNLYRIKNVTKITKLGSKGHQSMFRMYPSFLAIGQILPGTGY
jgi:hypothetical protein